MGKDAGPAVPDLAALLQDEKTNVRVAATTAIWRLGPIAKAAAPEIIKAYKDVNQEDEVRLMAAYALGKIGAANKDVVPTLIETLRTGAAQEKKVAALVLGQIGPDAKEAVPDLIKVYGNSAMDAGKQQAGRGSPEENRPRSRHQGRDQVKGVAMPPISEAQWLEIQGTASAAEFPAPVPPRQSHQGRSAETSAVRLRLLSDHAVGDRYLPEISTRRGGGRGLRGRRHRRTAAGSPTTALPRRQAQNLPGTDSISAAKAMRASADAQPHQAARDSAELALQALAGYDLVSRRPWKIHQCNLLRDIFGNPFRPSTVETRWFTSTSTSIAKGIYADRVFDRLPILGDALEEAGCTDAEILAHCRGPGPHVRGCWVVDLLLAAKR